MVMTPLAAPPSKLDPANFPARADALLTALPTFVTEANALEANVVAKEESAAAAKIAAEEAAGTAAGQVTLAAGQVPLAAGQVTLAADQVTLATEQKTLAEAAAQTAINAPGTSATSTTSLTVGTGSKTLTIQAGKALVPGMAVQIAYTTTPTTWMNGIITAYNSTTGALEVDVTATAGVVGTYAAWTVSLSAPAGSGGGSNATSYFIGQI